MKRSLHWNKQPSNGSSEIASRIAMSDAKHDEQIRHDERIRIEVNDEDKAVKYAKGCGCILGMIAALFPIFIIGNMCS